MRLVTAEELKAARIVPESWTRARIYEAARTGLLPCVRVGRQVLFDLDALAAWAAAGGTPLPGGWKRNGRGGDAA